MNCSMALEASELERNNVFGSATTTKEQEFQRIFCLTVKNDIGMFALNSALVRKKFALKKGQPEPPAQ